MEHILTLIAAVDGLDHSMAERVRSALDGIGAEVGAASWLSPGRALDLPFALLAADQAEAAARAALGGAAIDVVAQATQGRKKALLLADMDSTMVTGETLDELADFAGLKERIAAITARAMNGEIDFKDAVRERVGLLKDLDAEALAGAFRRIVFTPGGRELVGTMRKNGAYAILVSGGFSYFTERVGAWLGFDEDRANRLGVEHGRLTGEVLEPILDRDAKLKTLVDTAAARQLPLSATMAVGDGANDLDMIRAAGAGIAFHAKPMVAAAARIRIDHADLRALLYLQGYGDDEIAAA